MTRHGKNSTAGAVYTYSERQRDSRESGFGSQASRLGRDSRREFDCCCLTLQPCRDPVTTLDGFVYDKEAILEYYLNKKREISKQKRVYEKQKKNIKNEDLQKIADEQSIQFQKFENDSKLTSTNSASTSTGALSNMDGGKDKKVAAFWISDNIPHAKASLIKKPVDKVFCPMSGKPLKIKDLVDVKFTHIRDGHKDKSVIVKSARYVCPVTNDVLGNSVPCAVLKTSGSVVTMEAVEKLIKKDMLDPINGEKLKDSDIIKLQLGAMGFSAGGADIQKQAGPALMA